MDNPFKAISISLIPNFAFGETEDCWNLYRGEVKADGSEEKLKEVLEKYFDKSAAVTESGRLAMYLVLRAWGIGKGDEVVVQAFICSVVPAAVRAVGAKVVFGDIDESYNLDLVDLRKRITSKTKAVIVQHSFGKPVKMDELKKILGDRIMIIEDLAHGLGNSYKDKKLGTWGGVAVLSFGRDKAISGVWGGAVVADKETIEKVDKVQSVWPRRKQDWIKKQLLYPILMKVVLNSYVFLGFGKLVHWIVKKIGLLSEPISSEEKKGEMPLKYGGLPDELAYLILKQWNKLEEIIERRRKAANFYCQKLGEKYEADSSYLRYTIRLNDAIGLRKFAAEQGVFLGDWYDQAVAPKSIKPSNFGYTEGSCLRAEKAVKEVVNLPTNPNLSEKEWLRVVNIVRRWKLKR